MNAGLLVVSVILIIAGVASGFVPVIILGVFLLLPALATRRRARTEPRSGIRPRTTTTAETGQVRQTPVPMVSEAPSQTQSPPQPKIDSGMLPPLFPFQMFPTLNPVQFETQVPKESGSLTAEIPQELVEMAAIFLLGRFLSRRRR